jgi:antitoxin (DNA-binding transcriptional repressor) of toxin-antitoxin stability system
MQQYNIHAAKTHLSALVEKAAAGESFIIAKAGQPLVTVSAYMPNKTYPRVGFLKGLVSVPDDFNCMGNEEIITVFEETI